MKNILLLIAFLASINSYAQISNKYPNDNGIESDPHVLYVEKFNDDINTILSRYDEVVNGSGMFLDTDVPAGSNAYSLKITSEQGVNTGGHLYKSFTPGFDSTIYIRYYVKYPSVPMGYYGHQGVWFGGYNPALNWPYPRAGYCGLGDSRLSIAFENVWHDENSPGMDTYLYWGDMRSFDGGYTCFGNTMITEGKTDHDQPASSDAPVCRFDEWTCIEIMIKLNNPVSAYNGELKVWKDGVLLGHWGRGFPNGHWFKDKWYNNPNDPPFEGFRWRTDEGLNINWIWIEFWHNSGGESSYIKFSNIVMANEYIGPIYDPNTSIKQTEEKAINIYPNPTNGIINISPDNEIKSISIFDIFGQKLYDKYITREIDISDFQPGVYFLNIETQGTVHRHKIIKY